MTTLLDQWPPSISLVDDPQFVVTIVPVDYRIGLLNFCSDDADCAVSVPYSTNSATRTSYPFVITCRDIKPLISTTFNVSLCFGPSGAQVQAAHRLSAVANSDQLIDLASEIPAVALTTLTTKSI